LGTKERRKKMTCASCGEDKELTRSVGDTLRICRECLIKHMRGEKLFFIQEYCEKQEKEKKK